MVNKTIRSTGPFRQLLALTLCLLLVWALRGYKDYREYRNLDGHRLSPPIRQQIVDLLLSNGIGDKHDLHSEGKVSIQTGVYNGCSITRIDDGLSFKAVACDAAQHPNITSITVSPSIDSEFTLYVQGYFTNSNDSYVARDSLIGAIWRVFLGDPAGVPQRSGGPLNLKHTEYRFATFWPNHKNDCPIFVDRADRVDRLTVRIGKLLEVEESARQRVAELSRQGIRRIYLEARSDDDKALRCNIARELHTIGYQVAAFDNPFKESYSDWYVHAHNLRSFALGIEKSDSTLQRYFASIVNGVTCQKGIVTVCLPESGNRADESD